MCIWSHIVVRESRSSNGGWRSTRLLLQGTDGISEKERERQRGNPEERSVEAVFNGCLTIFIKRYNHWTFRCRCRRRWRKRIDWKEPFAPRVERVQRRILTGCHCTSRRDHVVTWATLLSWTTHSERNSRQLAKTTKEKTKWANEDVNDSRPPNDTVANPLIYACHQMHRSSDQPQ